jgi:Ni,Fe-hydrogenase I cytochrome b subunit
MDQLAIFFLVVLIVTLILGGLGMYSVWREKHRKTPSK